LNVFLKVYVDWARKPDWVSGRAFWEFISDDAKCIDKTYAIAAEVGRTFRDAGGQTLSQIIESKTQELEREFVRRYGREPDATWGSLLRRKT